MRSSIVLFGNSIRPGDKVDLQQGNALDLSRFADGTFDMTLLFGPMYHLYTAEDQTRALEEALRVTKPGGLLYVAYVLSDMAILANGIQHKGWFWSEQEEGCWTEKTYVHHPKPGHMFQTCRREDVEALAAPLPCRRLHYVAVDCAAALLRDTLAQMPPERFAKFMDYHDFLCERPDMAGLADHALDILRKDEAG